MCVWVYILEFRNGTYYTGITNNLERRTNEHRNGRSASTRYRGTFVIRWTKELKDRRTARVFEVLIKKTGAKRYLMKLDYRK